MCECKKELEDKSLSGDEFYFASRHESLYNSTYAVGYCTLYGLGTETNARKAVSLFLECARIDVNTDDLPFYVEGGWKPFQRQAYSAVINIYSQGICMPKDERKAFYYRKLICDMGIGTSQDYINLAACYQRGIGVDKDLAEGFKYLKKAADMNNNVATDLVADCLCHGIGVAKNSEEAQKYNLRGIAIVQDNPWEMG
jgi:TPR repeat protein